VKRKITELFFVFLAACIVGLAVIGLWGTESPVFEKYQYVSLGIVVVASGWIVFRGKIE
jgi:hypothetical protein